MFLPKEIKASQKCARRTRPLCLLRKKLKNTTPLALVCFLALIFVFIFPFAYQHIKIVQILQRFPTWPTLRTCDVFENGRVNQPNCRQSKWFDSNRQPFTKSFRQQHTPRRFICCDCNLWICFFLFNKKNWQINSMLQGVCLLFSSIPLVKKRFNE